MRGVLTVVAACGLAVPVAAQTRIVTEVSTDGGATWGSSRTVTGLATFLVQVRAQYTGTQSVMGLGGFTCQPTLTSWMPGDTRLPFAGTRLPGLGRPDVPGNTGPLAPFASINQEDPGTASGVLGSTVDPSGALRFAGSRATTMFTNLAWGMAVSQSTQSISGTNFNTGTNVVVFRYAVQLGGSFAGRTMVAGVPFESLYQSHVLWWTTPNGANTLVQTLTAGDLTSASITVLPAPSTAAMLALACVAGVRRRR